MSHFFFTDELFHLLDDIVVHVWGQWKSSFIKNESSLDEYWVIQI
jgi:hypothetical protein